MVNSMQPPKPSLEPSAASGLRALAVPASLRSSAAAQRERSAAHPTICRTSTVKETP